MQCWETTEERGDGDDNDAGDRGDDGGSEGSTNQTTVWETGTTPEKTTTDKMQEADGWRKKRSMRIAMGRMRALTELYLEAVGVSNNADSTSVMDTGNGSQLGLSGKDRLTAYTQRPTYTQWLTYSLTRGRNSATQSCDLPKGAATMGKHSATDTTQNASTSICGLIERRIGDWTRMRSLRRALKKARNWCTQTKAAQLRISGRIDTPRRKQAKAQWKASIHWPGKMIIIVG